MSSEEDFQRFIAVGGKPLTKSGKAFAAGPSTTHGWNFGLRRPEAPKHLKLSKKEEKEADEARAEMPKFSIKGKAKGADEKALLYDYWKHPLVVAANGFEYPGVHQITGSCFPGGTPVRMADGTEKAIEAVQVGEQVITHTGQARRVVETMTRLYDGDLITLHVAGFPFPLEMTADHPVAVVRSNTTWRWQPGQLEWVRADDIQEGDRVLVGWDRRESESQTLDVAALLGDQAVILDDLMERGEAPVSNVGMAQWIVRRSGIDWHGRVKLLRARSEGAVLRYAPVGPSLARLLGLYLAEGGCEPQRVVFTFDAREEDLAGEVLALVRGLFGVEGELERSPARPTLLKVRFNSTTLSAIFKTLVPGTLYQKRIPGIFFGADEETRLALLLGWMAGDGYAAIKKGRRPEARIQGVTASPGLARDMTVLALSCGIRVSCSRRKPRKQSREAFDIYLSGKKVAALFPAVAEFRATRLRHSDTDTARTRFGYARKVRTVERRAVRSFRVFDFEVEEDHSFLAGGLAVHNCVGAGGCNAWMTLACVEACRLNDAEIPVVPFWLLPYGRSRYYLGDRSPGEGSTGSTFAKAAREDGVIPANSPGLPPFTRTDGLVWGSSVEMKWSDGDNPDTMRLLPDSRKHLVKTTAQCRNADDVREAIRNGYPCTAASMYAHRPGVTGNPPVLLGRHSGEWSHQMSLLAWWDHPSLGEIFWLMNQWGLDAHGRDPAGGPPGGVWITKADVDWICRDEVFAFSQFDGFPAQTLPPWTTGA